MTRRSEEEDAVVYDSLDPESRAILEAAESGSPRRGWRRRTTSAVVREMRGDPAPLPSDEELVGIARSRGISAACEAKWTAAREHFGPEWVGPDPLVCAFGETIDGINYLRERERRLRAMGLEVPAEDLQLVSDALGLADRVLARLAWEVE